MGAFLDEGLGIFSVIPIAYRVARGSPSVSSVAEELLLFFVAPLPKLRNM